MKKFTQTTLIALLISNAVFSQTKDEPVKNPRGGTIINQSSNSQLILLSPADGKLFNASESSKPVLFRWTAIVPKPKEAVTYRLKVWQLMQGQNSTEAMRSKPPIVTKEVVNITQAAIGNLYTGPCKPPYLCDFVWAIEVLNSDGVSIGNTYAVNASFKFEVKNTEYGNPANPGSYGMSGGKSLNTNGDSTHKYKSYQPGKPIYGNISQSGDVESEVNSFEYGPKAPKDLSTGHSSGKNIDKEVDKGTPPAAKSHRCVHCDHRLNKVCEYALKNLDKELDKGQPTKSIDKELDKNQPAKSIQAQDGPVQGDEVKPVIISERRRPSGDASWELYKVKFPCNCFWCQLES